MIRRLLRLVSEHHTATAIRIADHLMAARNFAADCVDDLGETVFAWEQALRFHDQEHIRRTEKARVAVAFIIREARGQAEAEAKRWEASN